jgi:hypothetical protein
VKLGIVHSFDSHIGSKIRDRSFVQLAHSHILRVRTYVPSKFLALLNLPRSQRPQVQRLQREDNKTTYCLDAFVDSILMDRASGTGVLEEMNDQNIFFPNEETGLHLYIALAAINFTKTY